MGGFLSVGCWLYLDYTTKRRRSTAINELIQDEWEGFQRWMDYINVDFEVREQPFVRCLQSIWHGGDG